MCKSDFGSLVLRVTTIKKRVLKLFVKMPKSNVLRYRNDASGANLWLFHSTILSAGGLRLGGVGLEFEQACELGTVNQDILRCELCRALRRNKILCLKIPSTLPRKICSSVTASVAET
jgi:hypothetical protein